ncbi:MAG TPA: D-alanyl-D-alanine endopeptidase [Rhodocyclaceae bacterium]|nr:D-alanyl-D-alanine endopeptidase [Rhodocyclaceae bacterium]
MSHGRLIAILLSSVLVIASTADRAQAATRAKRISRTHGVAVTPVRARRVKVTIRPTNHHVQPDFDREGNPLLRSSAFMVQDLNSGQVLLEKNSDSVLPIASISKLMTSMVVLDAHQDLSEVIEITDDDVDRLKGTSSHLAVGTKLAREDVMRLALMASENRAASAMARNYPGGKPAFIEAMNQKAQALGLKETHFLDSSGLNKNNVSSARDLAVMVATASRYPLIRQFTTTTSYTVALNGRPREFHNTNALLKSPDWQIGVSKTGYINESGKCLVMQAWLANKPVAIVLLDSWGRFTRLADANRIRKWVETALGRQPSVAGLSSAATMNPVTSSMTEPVIN